LKTAQIALLFLSQGTVEFSSEITISASFTAECAENAEASEKPNVDWNVLKLCALSDLRGDNSLGFYDCAKRGNNYRI